MRFLVVFFYIFVIEFSVAASVLSAGKSESSLMSPPKVHHLIRRHNDEIYSIFEKHEIQKRQQFGPGFPDSGAPGCSCPINMECNSDGKCVLIEPTPKTDE